MTSQLAATFMEAVVRESTHGIDLHAGANHRANLPQVRAAIDDPETLQLARAFKVPVIINDQPREGTLRHAAAERGVRMLLYEAGEALRFDDMAIRAGLRGVLAVMQALGMLASRESPPSPIEPLVADTISWVRAPASGLLQINVPLGGRVARNTRIGAIADPFGGEEVEIRSPVSGMVVGRLKMPLVHRGDAVIHIAHLDRLKGIASVIEEFREEFTEEIG